MQFTNLSRQYGSFGFTAATMEVDTTTYGAPPMKLPIGQSVCVVSYRDMDNNMTSGVKYMDAHWASYYGPVCVRLANKPSGIPVEVRVNAITTGDECTDPGMVLYKTPSDLMATNYLAAM